MCACPNLPSAAIFQDVQQVQFLIKCWNDSEWSYYSVCKWAPQIRKVRFLQLSVTHFYHSDSQWETLCTAAVLFQFHGNISPKCDLTDWATVFFCFLSGFLGRRKKRSLRQKNVGDHVHISSLRPSFSDQFALLPSGRWAGLQREATRSWIRRHLRERPQAVRSSSALLAGCKNTANAHGDKYQIFLHRAFKTAWTLPPRPPLSLKHRWEARLPTQQWTSYPEVRLGGASAQMCRAHGRFACPICWWDFFTLLKLFFQFLRC